MKDIIVVGVDGSERAEKAAQRAAVWGASIGAAVHVVVAVDDSWSSRELELRGRQLSPGEEAEQIARNVAEQIAESGAEIQHGIVQAKPADGLVAEAERLGASLIVVGNHRVHGVGRLLGSVANAVVQHAPCDVLVVKTD